MAQIELLAAGPELPDAAGGASRPHVLFVLDGFPKALGGGERVVLRLAAMLPRYGFRTSILTLALHPESSFLAEPAPCPVYLLPLRNTYGLEAVRGAFALGQFLRRQKVSIVQTFFESSDLWAGLITRLFSPAKLVWSRRDMGILRGRKHHLAYRVLRRLPHAVSAVSARVAEHVVQVDGVDASRVHVVHNGLDLEITKAPEDRPDRRDTVITTLGNVRRVKGHDLLIRAAASVLESYPSATFTIAGEVLEPDFFIELERLVEALGLMRKVVFLGKVTDLRGHLEGADLFVLPSRSEGFSNALVEAMASGLPCVATDVGGNAEAIQDGKTGFIVPPEDASALADALLSLLGDRDLSRRLASAAQISAKEQFSSDAMLRKTSAIYNLLLKR